MRRCARSRSKACTTEPTSGGEERDRPRTRRHRARQRQRSRRDARSGEGARRARGRERGGRHLGPPDARADPRIRHDRARARSRRADRRRGWSRGAPRRARRLVAPAGHRRAGRGDAARRARRAALDRADAERRAGRDRGDRQVGRRQRGLARRPDPRGRRPGPRDAACRLSQAAGGRGGRARAQGRRADEVGRAAEVGDVRHAERSRVIPVDPVAPSRATLRAAADTLRAGGVVALPTETFYGLAAAVFDAPAVKRIFELKGRPESKPLLVLVDSVAMAETVASVTPTARDLMARYWPGALTLVLPAVTAVPSVVTAGTGTLGVRLSPHPIARGLVELLGAPVTAPSANPNGLAPSTSASGVLTYFPEGVDLVLDGGPTPGGEPSTVLDLTAEPPRIVRQGAVIVREGGRL